MDHTARLINFAHHGIELMGFDGDHSFLDGVGKAIEKVNKIGKSVVCRQITPRSHQPIKPKEFSVPKEIPILLLIAAGALALLDGPQPGPADWGAALLLGL